MTAYRERLEAGAHEAPEQPDRQDDEERVEPAEPDNGGEDEETTRQGEAQGRRKASRTRSSSRRHSAASRA